MASALNKNTHIILCLILIPIAYSQITYSQNYALVQNTLSFYDADAKCLFNYEQHLASIHNANDQTEASTITATYNVYIGMNDVLSEGTWVNVDGTPWDYGTTISPTGTFPWNTGEPNNVNSNEHCAHLNSADGSWNDNTCDTKFWFLCNYPGETTYIFNDPSWYSRTPSVGNQIGTIDILDEFYIEFDFEVHTWPANNGFGNIFHIGTISNERYPAIYTYTDGNGVNIIHSAFSVIDSWNPSHDSVISSPGGTHHYELHQTQDTVSVYIDSVAVYDGASDSHPIVFNYPIYLGNNFNDAADVTITNLVMTTNNLHVPNHFYYTCQTTERFTVIRGDWNMVDPDGLDSCWGLKQTTDDMDGGVVWLGDNDPSSLLWTDYTVEVDVKVTVENSAGQAGFLVRAKSVCNANDCGQQYYIVIKTRNNLVAMGRMNTGYTELVSFDLSTIGVTLAIKTYYLLRVEIIGATFKVYLNNQYLFTQTDNTYAAGSIGLRTYESAARFRYFRVIFPSDNQLITVQPTAAPTNVPTNVPTTKQPTMYPTIQPTYNPTNIPTQQPSNQPTYYPTYVPTQLPTNNPTYVPTQLPTYVPTYDPTTNPTNIPTVTPTERPSLIPTETPTTHPVIDNVVGTEVTLSVSGDGGGGFNDDTKQDGLSAFISNNFEMLLGVMLGSLLIIILCCCVLFIYWRKNKNNNLKIKDGNIELSRVSPTSASVEGNGTSGGTSTGSNGNMTNMMRINSVSSVERDGNRTNETMCEPGAEPEMEEPVVPIDNNQQLIQQQQFMAMNPMNMSMANMSMPMAMGNIQNDVMSVAMSMPNMMPNVMNYACGPGPHVQNNQSNVSNSYGNVAIMTNVGVPIQNMNDLPNEMEEEQNQLQEENDEEYEYYYDEEDLLEEEQDDNAMYGKGDNATSGH